MYLKSGNVIIFIDSIDTLLHTERQQNSHNNRENNNVLVKGISHNGLIAKISVYETTFGALETQEFFHEHNKRT